MDNLYRYIKRLLVFLLCSLLFLASGNYITVFISAPLLLLTFSILHARITSEKPPHLFAFYRTDAYFNKGGLRDLIRIFVTLFGFVYDTVIWTIWGIYLIFSLFVDLIDLIKTILYWILHAIVWFLKQYVPFLLFLYRICGHYLVRWPWWLYQIAWVNIRYAFNRNCYRIALWGTLQAAFIIFFFYFIEVFILDISGITFIGSVLALLPLTWSFGEIATIRIQKLENEPYKKIRDKFQNGLEAVRSVLFYITLFVVLLITQIGLDLAGWMPRSGIVIGGFLFSINTLISLILLSICILIVFGVIIIPSYRLFENFSETRLSHSINLLKVAGRKALQYFFVLIPATFFSVIILIIPFAIVLLAGSVTYTLKNSLLDIKINSVQTEQAISGNVLEAYALGKRVDQLKYLKQFPRYLSQEIEHRKSLANEQAIVAADLKLMGEELLSNSEVYERRIQNLKDEIDERKSSNATDVLIDQLEGEQMQLKKELATVQRSKQIEMAKLKIDIDSLQLKRKQIPLMFFFGGMWLIFFGSLVFAFNTAYMGNIFHHIFWFRNDDRLSEWRQAISEIRSEDQKQPLLGGTLFVVSLFTLYLLVINTNIMSEISMLVDSLVSFFS